MAAVMVLATSANAGTIRYVNIALNSGASNGMSWSSAFRGPLALQDALSQSQPGDTIWVAQGTYQPALPGGSAAVSFDMKSAVQLLGGFAGNETSESQRNPATNLTVLSGNLSSNLSLHVVTATNLGSDAVLDGFRISEGNASGLGGDGIGAGLLISGGSPVIRNCTFEENSAFAGGGIAIVHADPMIDTCTFGPNAGTLGAALYNRSGNPIIVNCTFAGMFPTTGGNSGIGIYSTADDGNAPTPDITVAGCVFSIQTTPFSCPAGIAIATTAGHASIRDCRFLGNTGCGSGAMQVEGVVEIDRCVFIGNEGQFDGGAAVHSFHGEVTLTNSLLTGNDRLGFSTVFVGGTLKITNCTIADNGNTSPDSGFGGSHYAIVPLAISTVVSNSIIWGNLSIEGSSKAVFFPSSVSPRFDFCLVQSWGSLPSNDGQMSFAADPMFVDVPGVDGQFGTSDDDYRLARGSPAIDRGNNSLLLSMFDLTHGPRRRDDTASADFLPLASPEIDLGAYERVPTCPADLNADGLVDDADFVLFADYYNALVMGGPFHGGDFTGDGLCDDADFVVFVTAYNLLLCP